MKTGNTAAHAGEKTLEDIPDEDLESFVSELRGSAILPDDEEYDGARRVWNGMIDRYPAIVARCDGVADVVTAVRFVRDHGLLVAIRGGGHNVAGHATCDGGLVIDLSPMNWIDVDPEGRTARVGGGATWGSVDHETQAFGLATPGGVVSTTGVAGLTLGGGYGYLRRKHGLTCDNLQSVDVVTADGRYLTASETEREDLFWAVRGGGGNFGVVTAFEYRLHPVGPEVATVETWHSTDDAATIVRGWRDFVTTAPDEVSAEMVLWSVPDVPDFPEELRRRPVAIVAAVHCGDLAEGERVLEPLRSLGDPLFDFSGPTPYVELQQDFDPFFPAEELRYYAKSLFLDGLDDAAIDAIVARAESRPHYRVLLDIWQMGGAVARVPEDEMAYSGRQEPFLLAIDATWEEPADDDRLLEWSRSFWAEMQEYSSGGLYLNFPGFGEEKEALLERTHGREKYERLADVKTAYDPENLFRLNQNVKPRA
ncbi:FAD-binding oxidoreductase [Natrarchaeobius oligotrophus]|uniref:FAD-binding oxidoreductase n=1 Tax=Natrarchaeobius chitinivorans TaxID=1679083 RepID=A0A3N6PIZ4_NATCH|nr:FAD-binding oxidoreductase [Natrarchaeobius chitinivorans]RQG98355.1 FAD-binding oxidoreductase [Natrarchaeobius chitinivorans]